MGLALHTCMPPPRRPRPKRSGEFLAEDLSRRLRRLQNGPDLERVLTDETNCRLYLCALRWPDGFVCPHCNERTHAETSNRGLLRCLGCGFVCSATTGTVLDVSPLPVVAWLRALWALLSRETGAKPSELRSLFPSASEHLVLDWLDTLQATFDRVWDTPLQGLVEVAKVPVEVIAKRHGRTHGRHAMVGIAVEALRDDELGGVRVCRLPRIDPNTMLNFVRRAVRPSSTVRTCNWHGYAKLRHHGYGHMVSRRPPAEEPSMEVAQQVASLLRLWLWSSRAMDLERLDYYLAEFNFRYNARLRHAASNRLALFNEVLSLALAPAMASATARAHSS